MLIGLGSDWSVAHGMKPEAARRLETGNLNYPGIAGWAGALDLIEEAGPDRIAIHADACTPGARVLLVDDLIATGGTAEAAVTLPSRLGAEVVAACFIVDLPELGGADKVRRLGVPVRTLVSFAGH